MGEQPAAVAREHPQQVELDRGQVDAPRRRGAPRGREVDLQPVDGDRRLVRLPLGARRSDGLQPRDQLARAERLGHVVVGAGLERAHLLRPPRRRAESTMIGISLHSRSARHDLDPVAVGQHEVDDRRVGRADRRRRRAPPATLAVATARSPPRAARPSARAGCASSSSQIRTAATAVTSAAPRPGWRRLERQLDHEGRALAGQRLGPHPAAVGLDEAPDDRQAEAGAGVPRAGARSAIERLEDRARARRRDARARGRRRGSCTRSPDAAGAHEHRLGRRSSGRRSRAGWRSARSSWAASAADERQVAVDRDAEGVGARQLQRPRPPRARAPRPSTSRAAGSAAPACSLERSSSLSTSRGQARRPPR